MIVSGAATKQVDGKANRKSQQEKPKARPTDPKIEDTLKKKAIKIQKRIEWPNKIADNLNLKGFTIDHHQV